MEVLNVLYEDNHLLVVNKPAELATMGAESGPTLHSIAAQYIRHKYNKPGKAFIGIVSRLDSVTTGVIVMARTSKGASRLAPQFSAPPFSGGKSGMGSGGGATKIYLAAIPGRLPADSGELTDLLYKDDRARRMRVTDTAKKDGPQDGPQDGREDAVKATLRYLTLVQTQQASLLAIQLLTGRKHQIRVQLADRGLPILGDRKYGSPDQFSPGIALHSWELGITHPTLKKRMTFSADLPRSWKHLHFPQDAFTHQDIHQAFS